MVTTIEDATAPIKDVSEIPVFSPAGSADGKADQAFRANPTQLFLEPYRELGSVFRVNLFGKEQIALGGIKANEFVWKNHELWDYYKTNRHFREQFSDRYLNQLEGKEYTKKRRRVNHGFRPGMLMQHTDNMSRAMFREIDRLPDGVTELRVFCMRVIIAMISQVLIQDELPPGMDTTMALSNREMLRASTMGRKRWLYYYYPPKLWKRRKIFSYLGNIIDEREKGIREFDKEDILSSVLSAKDPDEPPIPRYEKIHDLSQLFMAGSTTSSMIIMWSLLHSYLDPKWLTELREELKSWDPYGFDSITEFPKLRATTLEIERLHPGVPVFGRSSSKAFEFGGYEIPEGSDVLHLHTLTHFLEEFYDEPTRFDPMRFVNNPDLPQKHVHGTFSGGKHVCLGAPLARIQPPLFTANVVQNYDLEFLTKPSMKEKYDAAVAPFEEPMIVRFVKRR